MPWLSTLPDIQPTEHKNYHDKWRWKSMYCICVYPYRLAWECSDIEPVNARRELWVILLRIKGIAYIYYRLILVNLEYNILDEKYIS